MSEPKRIQLKRTKGFNLQAASMKVNGREAVNVARPGPWGNPFKIGDDGVPDAATAIALHREWLLNNQRERNAVLACLPGRNLACFCPPGSPCHADVLLELANTPATGGGDAA